MYFNILPPNSTHLPTHPKIKQNNLREKEGEKEERKKGKVLTWKLQYDTVSHTMNPFIHIFLHADVYQKKIIDLVQVPLNSAPPSTLEQMLQGAST